jgi:FAD:protein FMN transferase
MRPTRWYQSSKKLVFLEGVVLLLLVGGAVRGRVLAAPDNPDSNVVRLEESLDAMGSTFSVVAYSNDRVRLKVVVDQAFEEVRAIDQQLSNYRPESEWSQVNRLAAERPVAVSPELYGLLDECLKYSRESDGAFDITVGPLMKLWGFYKGSGRLPHRAEVRGVLDRIGYKNVVLDPKDHTVRFLKQGMEMDPGGIGKGYAVDRIVAELRKGGITSAMVAASSSSLYGLGAPPNEPRGWKVKIRDPKDEQKTIAEVFLKNWSLSTSGNYEKFFRAEGRIYSHIMDPRTGFPAPGMLSVSVMSPRTLDSEAWAKPYFILGRDWAARHKPADFRVFLCEDKPFNACAWLQ